MSLYLNVPFEEKDEAKALGAKWNPKIKKWYTDKRRDEYVKFSKWILKDAYEAVIATEYVYIIEGAQKCWKCGGTTKVVGLGIGEFISIYGDEDEIKYDICEDGEEGEELHLAWVEKEEDIPPRLLNYLKENYSVRTGFSKTIGGKCFANHCDCCNALQGNWFLFNEPDSPLSSCTEGKSFEERMGRLKIKGIPIDDDIQVNWSFGFCSNDYGYLKYGNYEELILSDDENNEYITYEELYFRQT